MQAFNLGKMTFISMFKEPETILYPVKTRAVPQGLKGHIAVDIEACILCSICQKRCPTSAIEVTKETSTWAINRFRCVQCGFCALECPTKCLSMEPTYASVTITKAVDSFQKAGGGELDEAAKKAKEEEKAARVKAALAAKAAREAEKAKQAE